MTSKNSLLLVAFFLFLSCEAGAESTHSIIRYDDLAGLVEKNNQLVAAAKQTVAAQNQQRGYYLRSFLPKIEVRGGYEILEPGSDHSSDNPFWKAVGSFNLFRGGQDQQEEMIRGLQVSAAATDLENLQRLQLLRARQWFWQIIALKEFIRIQKKALEDNVSHLKTARRRVGSGHATASDPIEFELEQTLMDQDLKRLVLELDKAKNQFAIILALDNHESLELLGDFTHPPDRELQDTQIQYDNLPQVKTHFLNRDTFKAEAKKYKQTWWPHLNFVSNVARTNDFDSTTLSSGDHTEFSAGMRLQIDFSDVAESQRRSQAKESLASGAEFKGAYHTNAIAAEVHELKHDLKLLHELLHDADASIVQAQKFLKLTLDEYGRGAKNGRDVLEAALKKVDFERRLNQLYQDYYTTRSELLAFTE